MKKIVVGSRNPVKVQSTLMGFQSMFPADEFEIESMIAPSNVSHQPMNEKEIKQGALNRAAYCKNEEPNADYWVGIEGGVENTDQGMKCYAWIVILSPNGVQGQGSTGTFYLPKALSDLIQQGKELGVASDIFFKQTDSNLHQGTTGILTHGALERTKYYIHGVILALIPFKNTSLYD